MISYQRYIYTGMVTVFLSSHTLHAQETTFYKAAKVRSYMPDSVVDEAYNKGKDVGYVTGIASKNIVYTTYKASHDAGYVSGKVAKKLWRRLWN